MNNRFNYLPTSGLKMAVIKNGYFDIVLEVGLSIFNKRQKI